MYIRASLVLFSITVSAFLCSCDDDEGDGGVDASTYDSFLAAAGNAWCDRVFACPTDGENMAIIRAYLQSSQDCRALIGDIVAVSSSADVKAAIEDGRVEYNAEAADDCLTQMQNGCAWLLLETSRGPFGSCSGLTEGTVAVGQPCRVDEECEGDAFCEYDFEAVCGGTCAARVALGEPCETDGSCSLSGGSDAAFCHYDDSSLEAACAAVDYGVVASKGQDCGLTQAATNIFTLVACAEGMVCATEGSSNTGTCAEPAVTGETCSGETCEAGSLCIDGQCTALTIVREVGGTCGSDSLAICDATGDLACSDNDSGTCLDIGGDGTAGSACGGDMEQGAVSLCNSGLTCWDGTCEALHANGQACSSDADCESGNCSNLAVCVASC